MKVLRIQPKKYPEVIEIDGSLKSLQKEVAGPIQAVYPWDDPVALICNEEGKLIGVSFNRTLMDVDGTPTDVIAGTFLIVGLTEDDFGDLSQEYNLHPTMYTLKVEAVALNVYDLKLNRGMEYQLLVGVGPTNTFYRKMNVTAKPRDVVKITQNGTILALRKGTAVVTAECGGVKAECAVTVGAYESFTIERALDGVSETNPVGSIVAGMSYQNVFNVGDSEKEMLELTVEMGGTDVTRSCVVMAEDNTSAQIKMASVTGNIKITANAAAKPVAAMLCADTLPVEVKPLKRVEGAFRLGR